MQGTLREGMLDGCLAKEAILRRDADKQMVRSGCVES